MDEPDKCPNCKSPFQGEKIPEANLKYYGTATHFSRVIALYDRNKDRTTHWKCPDCGHTWRR